MTSVVITHSKSTMQTTIEVDGKRVERVTRWAIAQQAKTCLVLRIYTISPTDPRSALYNDILNPEITIRYVP